MDLLISVRLGVNLLSKNKEYATSENLKSVKHQLQNPTHRTNLNTTTILGSENDTARLLILDSLFIQVQTPDLNNDS